MMMTMTRQFFFSILFPHAFVAPFSCNMCMPCMLCVCYGLSPSVPSQNVYVMHGISAANNMCMSCMLCVLWIKPLWPFLKSLEAHIAMHFVCLTSFKLHPFMCCCMGLSKRFFFSEGRLNNSSTR